MNVSREIGKYGVEAVTGERVLRVRLLRDMNIANNIINAWESRKQSDNWTQWTADNPDAADILERAHADWKAYVR